MNATKVIEPGTNHLRMVIPKPYDPEFEEQARGRSLVHMGEVFYMKPDVYEYKDYPVCKCGRKFVPVSKNDKKCFFCNFQTKWVLA